MAYFTGTLNDNPLQGTPDEDTFYEIVGDKTIFGGDSRDELITNQARGAKTFYGEGGNDFLVGGHEDLYVAAYHGNKSDYVINLTSGVTGIKYYTDVQDKTGAEGTDRLFAGVDELRFTDKSLYWIGDHWSTTERMTEGDDKISLKDNDDVLGGRDGNDVIYGNGGEDEIWGGNGNDTIKGGDDNDDIMGGDGNDKLIGDKGNDALTDDSGQNTLYGGEGDDFLAVDSSVASYLYGDAGDDTVYASGAKHSMHGGEGKDLIEAVAGNQNMYGDAGSDTFLSTAGKDIIRDFTQGEDVIMIQNMITYEELSNSISSNAAGDAVIHLEEGHQITIQGIAPEMLHESDFSFTL